MLQILDQSEFNVDNGLYIVKFTATWCGPCKKLQPLLLKLEEEFESIKFLEVDIDQVNSLASRFKIKSIPTLVLLKNGQEVDRIVGLSLIEPMRKLFRELSKND